VQIEVLLTENELSAQFLSAFEARFLPEKFFYWFPLSVKAWLALCQDGAYRNFFRSSGLVSGHSVEIAKLLPQDLEAISIGSGQGNKDILLLSAIQDSGRSVRYVPVDSSQALLEMACREAISSGIQYQAYKAEATNRSHLESIVSGRKPHLFMILGNTLGALLPVEMCRLLRAISKPGDFLLADGEIYAEDTIVGYDNPLNRRFAFAPLASVGIAQQDGSLVFKTKPAEDQLGVYYLTKHFQASRDLSLNIAGSTINIARSEKMEMSVSGKFSREAFSRMIGEEAGFSPIREFVSRDQRFLMVLAGA